LTSDMGNGAACAFREKSKAQCTKNRVKKHDLSISYVVCRMS